MSAPPGRPRFSFGSFVLYLLLSLLAIGALYFAIVLNWSYSIGERAGWVQQFSKRGWVCKTWEGEIALVSMPGAIPEKFNFTVLDDEVAQQINRHMGRRVALHYEQKVGLPTTCFGETRFYVTRVVHVEETPLAPGVVVPAQPLPPQTVPTPGGPVPPGAPSAPGSSSGPTPTVPPLQGAGPPSVGAPTGAGQGEPIAPGAPPAMPPAAPPASPAGADTPPPPTSTRP
jgi:hypothetical protein